MADIFVSYTSSDRDWAFWIGQELAKLGHDPHLHEWEISAGGNIAAWMEERHHNADHVLIVFSGAYLTKDYSNWERQAAQWAAASTRPNFALPVFIERCEAPNSARRSSSDAIFMKLARRKRGRGLRSISRLPRNPRGRCRFLARHTGRERRPRAQFRSPFPAVELTRRLTNRATCHLCRWARCSWAEMRTSTNCARRSPPATARRSCTGSAGSARRGSRSNMRCAMSRIIRRYCLCAPTIPRTSGRQSRRARRPRGSRSRRAGGAAKTR